jgi:hypothetical protein
MRATGAPVHAESMLPQAPALTVCPLVTLNQPSWLLFLGQHMLQNVVCVGDAVYVNHSGFYAGSVVVEIFPPLWEDFGFHFALVKGAWMERAKPGKDSAYFYLLVTGGMCSKIKCTYPGQWVLDEHPHNQIDPTHGGKFHILSSMKFHIQITHSLGTGSRCCDGIGK